MSTDDIFFCGEIRKIPIFLFEKKKNNKIKLLIWNHEYIFSHTRTNTVFVQNRTDRLGV